MKPATFGDFMRSKRIGQRMSLRTFCSRYGFDTAYISRLENDKLKPPTEKTKLETLAQCLGLKENTKDWVTLFDLAYQAKKQIPEDIHSQASEVLAKLPAFLRTPDGTRISQKKVKQLLKFINNGGRDELDS